jgi:large subunit ribosomal protein L13
VRRSPPAAAAACTVRAARARGCAATHRPALILEVARHTRTPRALALGAMSGPVVTKLATETPRMWHVVDAKNQVRSGARELGATRAARRCQQLLRAGRTAQPLAAQPAAPAPPRPPPPPPPPPIAQIIGRLAPQLARLLAGKHKPVFAPHVDAGDYVVVVNARHAVFTGDKMKEKLYKWHTGWFGGLKTLTARQVHERAPERLIEHAVKGMLAPNKLRKQRMTRLRIFPDDAHEHGRQVAASARYAPAFLAAFQPTRHEPPPLDGTAGTLVADYFRGGDGGLAPDARAAAEAALVSADPAAHMAQLDAELAAAAAAAAARRGGGGSGGGGEGQLR